MFTIESVSLFRGYNCLQVSFSSEQQKLTMHLKYTEMVGIVFYENMELGENRPFAFLCKLRLLLFKRHWDYHI